ncbi:MAG TPA: peptidoglycan DD-metalloendopeptidase family protein [Steroidobacteraceae bacterium]|jgi:murein DD-endopeptidase MepM/ murein hydrolase activator NlpD|nr:peptidoglycan DD-metalloendopeptidase family protein [Steroidobacteraceae bacterium]
MSTGTDLPADTLGSPWLLRSLQLLACFAVISYTLQVARHTTPPTLQLGTMLFGASDHAPGNPVDVNDISAVLAPGLDLAEVIVQRNDTLDHIFRRLQLSLSDLADVRALSGVQTMLDRLSPGEHLKFLHRDAALIGLERHLSLTEKLEVRRTDAGFRATVVPKAIQIDDSVAHGEINSSLFESANAAGLSDLSVLKLAKIFASDIDFVIGLREGDRFVVSYERILQNDHYVKDGDILAARFINQGRVYEAVRYVGPDGAARYYSPDGHSTEKAFLRAPLEFKRISSGFSLARMHPILNLIRAHKGIDYAAPIGTPVYAAGSGHIKFRGDLGGYGNVIQIEHGNGIVTVYGHMSRFAGARAGAHVERGETIGYVGMTGLATGPHLHFEFRVNGQYVDPQKIKLPDAKPIDPDLYDDFKQKSAPLLAALNP